MSGGTQRRIGRPPMSLNGRTVPERLVDVARDLFAERGFEKTSVQDVVAEAGVTKGAMYHYFASKDDLLAEVYGRVFRMQMARLDAFVESTEPIDQRLAGAAADVVVTSIENLPSTTIFFRSMHQLSPDHAQEVHDQMRAYHAKFRELVREGQAGGRFRSDVDADLVVDYFFGAVHHLPTWWRADRGATAQEVGQEFAALLMASLNSPVSDLNHSRAGQDSARSQPD